MRFNCGVALLCLAVLAGCDAPDYLMTSSGDPAAIEEPASLREGAPHYTSHLNDQAAAAAHPETVHLAIDERFSIYDRAKILRAVNEWNHVLNGFVRLDIGPATAGDAPADGRSQSWVIVPTRSRRPPPGDGVGFSHALALTQPVRPVGGVVIVYVDRLHGDDLVAVMRHELGHVLGLGHDPHGRLMSTHYMRRHQQCIDHAAAEAIAASRRLPAGELNWCEETDLASALDDPVTRAATR